MQGRLVFSFVGRLGASADGRETLIVYPIVPYDERLDRQEISIHTRWILFDEPVQCTVGVWRSRDNRGAPVFQVRKTLIPESGADTLARLGTVSVRLRREALETGAIYWVKVFSGSDLVTQYPLKLAEQAGSRSDNDDPLVH